MAVQVPSLDLSVEFRFRDWEVLGDLSGAFQPRNPAGFTEKPLEEAIRESLQEPEPAP